MYGYLLLLDHQIILVCKHYPTRLSIVWVFVLDYELLKDVRNYDEYVGG